MICNVLNHVFVSLLDTFVSILLLIGVYEIIYLILEKFFIPNVIFFEGSDKKNGRIKFKFDYHFNTKLSGIFPGGYDITTGEIYIVNKDRFVFVFHNDKGDNIPISVKIKDIPKNFMFKMTRKILYNIIFIPKSYKNKENFNYIDIKINKKMENFIEYEFIKMDQLYRYIETKDKIMDIYEKSVDHMI